MIRRKKALKIAGFVLGGAVLLGCSSGVVCGKGFDESKGELYVEYKSDVDSDGTGGKVTRVKVDEGKFISCMIDEQWPECQREAVNVPRRPMNDPINADKWKEKDENSKTVCVSSVSQPTVKITNTWFIGNDPKTEKAADQGIFERCMLAKKGAVAYIKSEHHSQPSTLLCSVWIWEGGKKKILDYMITQALGDCEARAVIR